MNILVIPSWYDSIDNETEGSFFKEQAESLVKLGHNVYLLYSEIIGIKNVKKILKTPKKREYIENNIHVFRDSKVKRIKGKGKYVSDKFTNSIERLYLDNIHKKIRIDVIHAHSFIWGGVAGAHLKRKYGIPLVVTEHYTGYARNTIPNNSLKSILEAMDEADDIIAVSSGLRNHMINYGCKRGIKVIPNMVSKSFFHRDATSNDRIDNKSSVNFLTVCYLMKKKGIDVLINSMSEVVKKDENVKLYIGGDGPEKNNLQKQVEKLNLQKNVMFLGALSRTNVKKYMDMCDCFVLPSRFETFGVVYIEALSLGKPVIGTNTDAIEDIINKNNGLIVKKDNIEELAEAMTYMKNNYMLYCKKDIINECWLKFSEENVSLMIEDNLKTNVIRDKRK